MIRSINSYRKNDKKHLTAIYTISFSICFLKKSLELGSLSKTKLSIIFYKLISVWLIDTKRKYRQWLKFGLSAFRNSSNSQNNTTMKNSLSLAIFLRRCCYSWISNPCFLSTREALKSRTDILSTMRSNFSLKSTFRPKNNTIYWNLPINV